MNEQNQIRRAFFNEGMNISEIAKKYGVDRKTVRRYLERDNWNQPPPELPTAHDVCPKLEPYKETIDEWLEGDKKAKTKQRHTAWRVYKRLTDEEGFNCSYRTVAAYVKKRRREIFSPALDSYLPLEHPPGEAQADFGSAQYYEGGQLIDGKYFNLSFPASNQGYLQLFPGENAECLLEGMDGIFRHIGGVPTRIWFDNASAIVKGIIRPGRQRVIADRFLRFMNHYGFEAAYCNPDQGHEKGSVEGKVGYHRRNLLVPIPVFDDMDEYNGHLLAECDKDAQRDHYRKNDQINELFQEDRKHLLALPTNTFELADYMTVRTDAYGIFSLDSGKHEYSTMPKYANARVLIRLTSRTVTVLDGSHRPSVQHVRLYGEKNQRSMQWLPYLSQVAIRPRALKYTGIYDLMPPSVRDYFARCDNSDAGKMLREMAAITSRDGFEGAIAAVEKALEIGAVDADSVHSIHRKLFENLPDVSAVPMEGLPAVPRMDVHLDAYDWAMKMGGGANGKQ
jgi:transposase